MWLPFRGGLALEEIVECPGRPGTYRYRLIKRWAASEYRAPCTLIFDGGLVDLAEVVRRQFDGAAPDVLLQTVQLRRARDRARSTASAPAARPARSGRASRFFAAPISPSRSTTAWFAFRASGENRGTMLRKSALSKSVFSSIFAGQEALAQRTERHEADAQLLERRQDLRPPAPATTASIRFAAP